MINLKIFIEQHYTKKRAKDTKRIFKTFKKNKTI